MCKAKKVSEELSKTLICKVVELLQGVEKQKNKLLLQTGLAIQRAKQHTNNQTTTTQTSHTSNLTPFHTFPVLR